MHTALGDAKPILSKCAGLSWPSHIDWQRWVGRDLKVRAVVVAGGGVSISSVVRFRRLHRETGSVIPAKFGGYKGYALAAHEDLVRPLAAEQPDITLAELKAVLATEKVTIGQSSISPLLHPFNLPFNKNSLY